jgi:predicted TIM-barrel fold metal-dependent hydrolase
VSSVNSDPTGSTTSIERERVPFASMVFGDMNRSLQVRQEPVMLPEPDARELWCPVISADDHVLEPGDLFEKRLPARLVAAAPKLVEDESGVPFWRIEDKYFPITVANGAVGRPTTDWFSAPQKFTDFRPGVSDTKERVADMDLNGIWASLCFPSFVWGFAGRRFSAMSNAEAGLACFRAYNDWMIDEWCGSQPGRFIPCQIPWLADPAIAAQEIRSNAERGFRAVSFPETPSRLGFPSVYSEDWNPFFEACEETETVINLHVGASGLVARPSEDSPHDVEVVLFPVNGLMAMVDWLFARIPIRFPNIKVALSEAGVSWVPMMMERLDRSYRHVDASHVWSRSDPSPRELVQRNFWFTSIEDPSAFHQLDIIGEDRVVVESDYPHMDSTWPDTQALLASQLGHLAPSTIHKIAYGNAAGLYRHPLPPSDWLDRAVVKL